MIHDRGEHTENEMVKEISTVWVVWEEIPQEDKSEVISIHKTKDKAVKKCEENPNY